MTYTGCKSHVIATWAPGRGPRPAPPRPGGGGGAPRAVSCMEPACIVMQYERLLLVHLAMIVVTVSVTVMTF